MRDRGGYRLSPAYVKQRFNREMPEIPELKPAAMEAINSGPGDPILPVIIPQRDRTPVDSKR